MGKHTCRFFRRCITLRHWAYFCVALGCAFPLFAFQVSIPKTFDDYNNLVLKYRFSDPDSGIYFATQALHLSEQRHDNKWTGIMLNHLGIIDENQGRFDLARQKYLRAIDAYKKIKFSEGIADETIRLGVTEMRKGNFNIATQYFFDALKIHEASGNKRGIMECNITLGEAYMGQSNYKTAIGYLKKAEGYSRSLPLMGLTLYIYNNIGVVYKETGDLTRSISYLEKGVALSDEPQFAGIHVTLLNSLGMTYAKAGFRDKAVGLQLAALEQARQIRNYLRELQTLNGLADTYSKSNPKKAHQYLAESLRLSRQRKASKVTLETLQRMGTLYEQEENFKEALRVHKEERSLSDSLFSLTKSTEIANLQTRYELQQSQANVERLKYLSRNQIIERNIILFVCGVIVSFLLILAYYLKRTRDFNSRLHLLNSELKEANEVKDKLFSIIGHDLRAPLATIKTFLSLLEEGDFTVEEQQKVLHELSENCDASVNTLDKLLRWGQLQLKGMRINPTNFIVREAIEESLLLLKKTASEKNIIIYNDVDDGIAAFMDRDHFDFIIRNLVNNAIKFTPQGGHVWINAAEQHKGMIILSVKDDGVGIEPDRLSQIFGRVNESTMGTNGEKGTSLGLLMCKEFVEANEGHIHAELNEDRGTSFIFTIRKASTYEDNETISQVAVGARS